MKHLSKYIFLVPLVLLALTPVLWFLGKGQIIINGVDTNFPLDPLIWFQRRFFVWNNVVNGGIDFSSSTAGLFFHLIQVIPYKIGFSLQFIQIINLIFWFFLIILNSFIFAKVVFPKSFLIQILFVVFYAFNPYLFNTWENVKVANLSLIAAIPVGLAVIISLDSRRIDKKRAAFISALIGIILSGSGINPAYFSVFFVILTIFLISSIITNFNLKSILFRAKNFLLVSSIIFLVNLFWILPTANFIARNIAHSGSIDKIGFTNWVDSLSENTSLLNIMRVQGAWDWYAFDQLTNLPLYIPYVLNYFYKFPFIFFSFLIPSLAILALIFRKENKKEIYLFCGSVFIIGVFLGTGTHLPTGTLFRYFLEHVPFFTLFRSPWYIFTSLVILSSAGLISLLFEYLSAVFSSLKFSFNKLILFFLIAALIIGNLLYSYPLITGKIFRPARADSFYIKFPDYLFDSKQLLSEKLDTRIVGYPDDDLEKFKWGYTGIESILELYTDQEMLFSSFNMQNSASTILLKEFYKNLKRGRVDTTFSLASKLDIGWIFYKRDQATITSELPMGFKDLPKKTFGQWDFYQLQENNILPKIFIPASTLVARPYNNSVEVMGLLNYNQVVVNPDDKVINNIHEIYKSSDEIILADNLQVKDFQAFKFAKSNLADRLQTKDLSKVEFVFDISEDGIHQPVLERYNLKDFGIDETKDITLEIDGKSEVWDIDNLSDSFLYFKPRFFSKGQHKIILKLRNANLIIGGNFDQGMNFMKGGYGEGKGIYEIKEDGLEKFLSIRNIKKADVSADFIVSPFDEFEPYYIELKYKQIYGNNGLTLVSQNNKETLIKTQVERLPNYPDWNLFSFYYEPVATNSTMKVILSAPFIKDPLGTNILYDDLKVYKVFTNNLFLQRRNGLEHQILPEITSKKINPTLYEGQVTRGKDSHIIVFAENYTPDWELSLYREDGLKIPTAPPHFSANLYANAWYIKDLGENYRYRIYYKPQRLFVLGGITAMLTIAISAIIFMFTIKRRSVN